MAVCSTSPVASILVTSPCLSVVLLNKKENIRFLRLDGCFLGGTGEFLLDPFSLAR